MTESAALEIKSVVKRPLLILDSDLFSERRQERATSIRHGEPLASDPGGSWWFFWLMDARTSVDLRMDA